MDVYKPFVKILFLLTFSFIFSACEKKTVESVDQTDQKNPYTGLKCAGDAVPNQYIIRRTDGKFEVVRAKNRDELIEKFIKPNLESIEFVENDRVVVKLDDEVIAKRDIASVRDFNSDQLQSSTGEQMMTEQLTSLNVQTLTKLKNSNELQISTELPIDNWGQDKIGASKAWDLGISGEGVIVGVVDAGVDINHPELAGQIAINEKEIPKNGLDDDQNGFIDDDQGYDFFANRGGVVYPDDHGTHVSGIILGDSTKGPIKGLAPKAKLIPANFMSEGGGSLGAAIQAIKYVVSRGARVINASWGGSTCSNSLKAVFNDLETQDVLISVAAGNSQLNLDYDPDYPAAFNAATQITVAATSNLDRIADFSNFGKQIVHVGAPGLMIWSTVMNGAYEEMKGTSMAAPFVSGTAALLFSHRPKATAVQVKQAIINSVDNIGLPVVSRGRINIQKAIAEIEQLVPQ